MTSPIIPGSSESNVADTRTTPARPQTTETADVRKAITTGNARFLEAFRSGDSAAIASCYTPGGQVLPPNAPVSEGRDALEAFWRETLRLGLSDASLETRELFHAPGDAIATEIGRYALKGADGDEVDRGKYVVVWQCDAHGEWRIHRDIWASDLPLPTVS